MKVFSGEVLIVSTWGFNWGTLGRAGAGDRGRKWGYDSCEPEGVTKIDIYQGKNGWENKWLGSLTSMYLLRIFRKYRYQGLIKGST